MNKNCSKCGKEIKRAKTGMCQSCIKIGKKRPDMVGNKFREGLPSWNKGKKLPQRPLETREKQRRSMLAKKHLLKTMFVKGQVPWNKGLSNTWMKGEKNHNWKGGATKKNALARRSPEMKAWRMSVLVRDSFTCQMCNAPNSFHADHIKSFAEFPELRYNISNGRTLCEVCHKNTPNYLNWKNKKIVHGK